MCRRRRSVGSFVDKRFDPIAGGVPVGPWRAALLSFVVVITPDMFLLSSAFQPFLENTPPPTWGIPFLQKILPGRFIFISCFFCRSAVGETRFLVLDLFDLFFRLIQHFDKFQTPHPDDAVAISGQYDVVDVPLFHLRHGYAENLLVWTSGSVYVGYLLAVDRPHVEICSRTGGHVAR